MTVVSEPNLTPLPTLRVAPELGAVQHARLPGRTVGSGTPRGDKTQGPENTQETAAEYASKTKPSVAAEVCAEIGLLLAALAASLGVARLIQGGLGIHVVGPILLTVLAGGLASGFAARKRISVPLVAAIGIVASALVAIWTISPGSTWLGVPTLTTVHHLVNEINRARSVMGSHRTPVPAVAGVVFIASISAGAVCIAARSIWELSRRSIRRWPRLLALVPTFGMFCYSAPLSALIDRPQTALAYLASALFFIAASDTAGPTLQLAGTHNRIRSIRSTLLAPIATGVTALVVLLIAAAALAGTVPVPFPWWTNEGPGIGGLLAKGVHAPGHLTALSLVANLRGDETTSATVQMFQATSPVPTYWQVGVLTVFDGTKWIPGRDEYAALSGTGKSVPPIPALPGASNTFVATVTIQDYSGRLLPAPPLTLIPGVNSAIQSMHIADGIGVAIQSPTTTGQSYQLVAQNAPIPSLSSKSISLQAIYSGLGNARSQYLALPGGIPTQVKTLAEQVVKGAKTPVQEAQDLVNFLSGPAFAYTLTPPPVPAGQNPLITFLFTYRLGFCQQFAGAFGVMARELGLPVRLAVGFTTGHAISKNSDIYEVTGADAHVWPEVYLGPALGWVSWDPTPGPTTGEPNAVGFIKYRHVIGSKITKSQSLNGDVPPKDKRQSKLPRNVSVPATIAATTHKAKTTALPAGLILAGVFLVLLIGAGLLLLLRSKRSVRQRLIAGHHSSDPDHVVLRAWVRASTALARAGFQRSLWVTPVAHAEAVRTAVTDQKFGSGKRREDATAALGAATFGYLELAELTELACYCPGRCTNRDARHAEQEAWRIERALRQAGLFRRFPGPPTGAHTAASGTGRITVTSRR